MVLPDIRTPRFSRSEILESIKNNWPTTGTTLITMDSYFGCLSTLRVLDDHFATFSLASKNESMLTELFAHNISYHELRMFKKDSLVLALWLDNNLMITGTNCFKISSERSHPKQTHHGTDLLELPPRLSIEDTRILATLSLDGLKLLCKDLGICSGIFFFFFFFRLCFTFFSLINNEGGSKQELACKIGRIPYSKEINSNFEVLASTSKDQMHGNTQQLCAEYSKRKLTNLKEECKKLKLSHSKVFVFKII